MITESDIYALQAHARARGDMKLLDLTYQALGYSRRYAFSPVTSRERTEAQQGCADQLEMMRLIGERMQEVVL